MDTLFKHFSKTSKADWLSILTKELKDAPISALHKIYPVEEISFPSYFHQEDGIIQQSDPGLSPFTRGIRNDTNTWSVGNAFLIENPKENNKQIVSALMKGADHIFIYAKDTKPIDFKLLFNEVGLSYIKTTFFAKNTEQANDFIRFGADNDIRIILEENTENTLGIQFNKQVKPYGVNAYAIQQAGGSTWQEIAFALSEGHQKLVNLLDAGLDIDDAAGKLHFVFGIGSKYLFEIGKIRAFRALWSKIISQYQPKHECSKACTITSISGFVNISLKDPYTNLLRQTTQGLSAITAGVDSLLILPYDWHGTNKNLDFSQRLATNISNLLKEESYLDKVIDPAGGTYAIENLTESIAERAWTEFVTIEDLGGINSLDAKKYLSKQIEEKAALRLQLLQDKKEKLIGINIFPNPENIDNYWENLPNAWENLPYLILEQKVNN